MSGSYDPNLVNAQVGIGSETFEDVTVKEVILGESLLTPGLQTAVTLQSFLYTKQPKIWETYKNQPITIKMADGYSGGRFMMVNQKIYRIDNRGMDINVGQTETLTLHACDQSLLEDCKKLISKSWKCTQPSEIVRYALTSCVNAQNPKITDTGPARDYIAENIHPFQVIQQQCNVALYQGNNPDFVHYMRYDDGNNNWQPTHFFKSINELQNQGIYKNYSNVEGGGSSTLGFSRAINFSFPCDFDLLSDLLNGIDENGRPYNTVASWNPLNGTAFLYGETGGNCSGIGAGNAKSAMTNKGTAQEQNGCNFEVEKYLLLRQARMGLLEKDKIAFRMTIPWDPDMHVGNVISFNHYNKLSGNDLAGSGVYLVVAMKHNIQFGGFSTTTVDCIKTQVG